MDVVYQPRHNQTEAEEYLQALADGSSAKHFASNRNVCAHATLDMPADVDVGSVVIHILFLTASKEVHSFYMHVRATAIILHCNS